MSILVKKIIFLKGITVFLPLAEMHPSVKVMRKLVRPLYKRSKVAPEINSPVDFFHILFPSTCLRK